MPPRAVTTEQYADPVNPRPITLSDIDTTRALRTDDELLRLVAAIHGSRPEAQETNWLECKSTLDLSVAAGKFAVAKAVLGFANRSVDDARPHCGGVPARWSSRAASPLWSHSPTPETGRSSPQTERA